MIETGILTILLICISQEKPTKAVQELFVRARDIPEWLPQMPLLLSQEILGSRTQPNTLICNKIHDWKPLIITSYSNEAIQIFDGLKLNKSLWK